VLHVEKIFLKLLFTDLCTAHRGQDTVAQVITRSRSEIIYTTAMLIKVAL
jgi:hypothetical protein